MFQKKKKKKKNEMVHSKTKIPILVPISIQKLLNHHKCHQNLNLNHYC
jgi:hypothetical protein